jgi:hypothetical protein
MKKLVPVLICLSILASCKKHFSEEDMPPATQTGANTFGARVNGEVWIPHQFGVLPANDLLDAYFAGPDLTITANNFAASPTETGFKIFIKDVTTTGTYHFNADVYPNFSGNYAYYVKRRIQPINEWVTNASYTGTVTITKLDSINHIVSGTFQFNMINLQSTPEPLNVTEGRFDIRID